MCGRYVADQSAIERAWKIDARAATRSRRVQTSSHTEVPVCVSRAGARAAGGALGPHPALVEEGRAAHAHHQRAPRGARASRCGATAARSRCLLPAEAGTNGRRSPAASSRTTCGADGRPCASRTASHAGALELRLLTKAAEGRRPRCTTHAGGAADEAFAAGSSAPRRRRAIRSPARAGAEFNHYAVSKRVNNARHEGADLIERWR